MKIPYSVSMLERIYVVHDQFSQSNPIWLQFEWWLSMSTKRLLVVNGYCLTYTVQKVLHGLTSYIYLCVIKQGPTYQMEAQWILIITSLQSVPASQFHLSLMGLATRNLTFPLKCSANCWTWYFEWFQKSCKIKIHVAGTTFWKQSVFTL